jgi:Flp pilus assembly pilin Flp
MRIPHLASIRRTRLGTKGAAMIEYAVLLTLAGAIAIGTIFAVGGSVTGVFGTSDTVLSEALEGSVAGGGGTPNGGGGESGPSGPPQPTGFQMLLGSADDKRACVHGVEDGERATYCWGLNWNSAFGDGTSTSSNTPVRVQLTGVITDLHTSVNKTCSVQGTNLLCSGDTTYSTNSPLPTLAPYSFAQNVRTFVQSLADYTCAALTDGSLACVDGGGTAATYITSGVFDVAGSYVGATCALMVDRTLQCEGDPQLGGNWGGFVPLAGLSDVDQVVGTRQTFCALVAGTVSCWGYAEHGLLGTGEVVNRATPAVVPGANGAIGLYTDGKNRAICAAMPGGAALCWGRLPFGTDGASIDVATPTSPPGWPGGTPLVGEGFLCAGLATGGVRCMGQGPDGELGDGTNTAQTSQWRTVAFPSN